MAQVKPDLWFSASVARNGLSNDTTPTNLASIPDPYLGFEQKWSKSVDTNLQSMQYRLNELFKENPSWRNKKFMMAAVYNNGRFQSWSETDNFNNVKNLNIISQANFFFWCKECNYEEAHRAVKPTVAGDDKKQYRPFFISALSAVNNEAWTIHDTTSSIFESYISATNGMELKFGETPSSVSLTRFPISGTYATFEDFIVFLETFPIIRPGGSKYITTTHGNATYNSLKNSLISVIIYDPAATADNVVTRENSYLNSGAKTYSTKIVYLKGDPFTSSGTTPVEVPPSGLPGLPEYDEDKDSYEGAFSRAQLGQDILKIANENPQLFLQYGQNLIQVNTFTKTKSYR